MHLPLFDALAGNTDNEIIQLIQGVVMLLPTNPKSWMSSFMYPWRVNFTFPVLIAHAATRKPFQWPLGWIYWNGIVTLSGSGGPDGV
jgi:hypothetical protein